MGNGDPDYRNWFINTPTCLLLISPRHPQPFGPVFALLYYRHWFAGGISCPAWCDTPGESKWLIFPCYYGKGGAWGEGSAQGCSQDIAGIRMMVGLLGCRCTRRAGEVTLAMVTAIETTQPSVPANEEVTPHHCLVRQGTLGSLEGPDLLVWH